MGDGVIVRLDENWGSADMPAGRDHGVEGLLRDLLDVTERLEVLASQNRLPHSELAQLVAERGGRYAQDALDSLVPSQNA